MKITNVSPGPRGINTKAGLQIIPAGQSIDAGLSDVELKGSKETGWFDFGKADKAKTADSTLKAVHRGGGSYSIMDGDKEVAEKLSKGDAEAFNAMSDEDKAKFVAEYAKAD